MPLVTNEILALTLAGMKTEFDLAYFSSQEEADWQHVATEIPTTLPTQQYGWLGRGAVMEQFHERLREQTAREMNYSLTDITYKGVLAVDRRAIEDDQYGMIMRRVQALGAEPVRHWDELAYTQLALGFTANGYDATTFFSSSHNEGLSGTQSNVTSSPLSDAALQIAEQSMTAVVDDKGKPMKIKPRILVVGPAKARQAHDLTESETIVKNVGDGTASSGATAYTPYKNFFKGRYRVVESPYLIGAYSDFWFLLDDSKVIKPVLIQSRSDVPITIETNMLDGNAHLQEEYLFGPRGRYVAGFGLWQCAYGSNATS